MPSVFILVFPIANDELSRPFSLVTELVVREKLQWSPTTEIAVLGWPTMLGLEVSKKYNMLKKIVLDASNVF